MFCCLANLPQSKNQNGFRFLFSPSCLLCVASSFRCFASVNSAEWAAVFNRSFSRVAPCSLRSSCSCCVTSASVSAARASASVWSLLVAKASCIKCYKNTVQQRVTGDLCHQVLTRIALLLQLRLLCSFKTEMQRELAAAHLDVAGMVSLLQLALQKRNDSISL